MAGKIAEGGEAYLIERAKQVNWAKKNPALLEYGDEGIDPFSFIYFLASKNTKHQRETVYNSVGDVFEIRSRLPTGIDDCYIFPLPTFNMLFHKDKVFHTDLLWRLFGQVAKEDQTVEHEDFREVLGVKTLESRN